MVHVDPHSIKVIPAAAKAFMGAQRYAVVGRVLNDPSRFDNKVLKWYQERNMPVTPVRPPSDRVNNAEPIEGLKAVDSVTDLPDIPHTSLSVIISPKLGLPMLKTLFADRSKEPHAVWLQPGAESDDIDAFIKEHNLGDKIVYGGPCVLVHGDEARQEAAKL